MHVFYKIDMKGSLGLSLVVQYYWNRNPLNVPFISHYRICKMDILESLRISLPVELDGHMGLGCISGSLGMIICPSMPLKVQRTAGEKEK